MKYMLLFLLISMVSIANAFANDGEKNLNYQKKALNAFAIKASKAKDIAELYDKSMLHWRKGFKQMRDSGKGVAVPKILVIKNGIEINAENQKVSIIATQKVATLLVNNQEYTPPVGADLNSVFRDVQKLIGMNAGFRFSWFSEAHAGEPSLMLIALLGVVDTVSNWWHSIKGLSWEKFSESVTVCRREPVGSFEILSGGDAEKKILEWDAASGLKIEGKKFGPKNFPKNFTAAQVGQADVDIKAEIKTISENCKKQPGSRIYKFSEKENLEKNVEAATPKSSQ